MAAKAFVHTAFFQEPAGCFALGQVLMSPSMDVDLDQYDGADDVGSWQCDLTNHDALTWSDKVYEIFGLPLGSQVEREDAVAKYREHSRGVLERLRSYAIHRKCGFMLDAAINSLGDTRWVRILAAPVIDNGRVIGLRGLKRVIKPENR